MKTLETLYKRTRTSAIQYWKISIDQNVIIKESGQLGTDKPLIHRETVIGKNVGRSNETTSNEQAEFDAGSDWRRKHDEGYKSLVDLNINPINSPSDDLLAMVLNETLPQFNTDASGNVKCMLATDWQKIKKIEYPVLCEPKLDGVRCLLIVDGPRILFLSRSGKEYTTLGHIAHNLLGYVAEEAPDMFILDGEIYSDELTFQDILAAVKKQREDSLKLKFRAYDLVSTESQIERKSELKLLIEKIDSPFIQEVEYFVVTSPDEVKSYHDRFVQAGNEGAILRLKDGLYAQGQRSRELLKVKEFDEKEFEVTAFEHGQRGVEDLIAVCLADNGKEFRAKMQGTLNQKLQIEVDYQEAYEQEKDSKLTVKFFGLTSDGIPRFPIGKALRNGY